MNVSVNVSVATLKPNILSSLFGWVKDLDSCIDFTFEKLLDSFALEAQVLLVVYSS